MKRIALSMFGAVALVYALLSGREPNYAGALPGLLRSDLVGSLRAIGLQCDGAKRTGETYLTSCRHERFDYSEFVLIYGPTPRTVDLIQSSVNQFYRPSDERALRLFGVLGSIEYGGGDSAFSEAWTLSHLSAQQDQPLSAVWMHRGGARFRFSGPVTARSLDIEYLPAAP